MKAIQMISKAVSKYLPLWIALLSLIAYFAPDVFTPIQPLSGFGLGTIFFLMGLTLTAGKLWGVIRQPKRALTGVLLKWTIMVGVSIAIAYLFFRNEAELAAGIILAGTVPSGTSANIYTFIAGGEVALSVTMATLDTFISPFLTPSLLQVSAGRFIPIEFLPLFLTIIYIVLLPLAAGLLIQWKLPKQANAVNPYTGLLSQLALFLVILSVISNAQHALSENLHVLPLVFIAAVIQVCVPMFSGYFIAKRMGLAEKDARSILFHVGICNTALAATLAMEHFGSLAAVPAVANMIVNLLIGASAASVFDNKFRIADD